MWPNTLKASTPSVPLPPLSQPLARMCVPSLRSDPSQGVVQLLRSFITETYPAHKLLPPFILNIGKATAIVRNLLICSDLFYFECQRSYLLRFRLLLMHFLGFFKTDPI